VRSSPLDVLVAVLLSRPEGPAMIYKVYICPDDHIFDGAAPITDPVSGRLVCSFCDSPVDEVEVVRLDELLSEEAINRAGKVVADIKGSGAVDLYAIYSSIRENAKADAESVIRAALNKEGK